MEDAKKQESVAPFALYCCLTTLYGAVGGAMSPSLPDFATQASLSSAGQGSLFIWRGVASMTGAFTMGRVVDACRDPHKVLATLLAMRIVAHVCMPAGWNLLLVSLDIMVSGFAGNSLYLVGTVCISWTYGKLLGARVSLMDAGFGIGGSLSPMLASVVVQLGYAAVNVYRALALVDVVLLLMAFLVRAEPNPRFAVGPDEPAEESTQEASAQPQRSDGYKELREEEPKEVNCAALAVCCGLVFCSDVCVSSPIWWFYTHATQNLGLDPVLARAMNSALWVIFTALQIVWAALQNRGVKAVTILQCQMPLVLLSAAGMATPASLAGPWLPTLCMVCVDFGGGLNALITATLRQITFLDGTAFGYFRIASACGNMVGGAGVGFLAPVLGSLALPVVSASGMLLNIVLLNVLIRMY